MGKQKCIINLNIETTAHNLKIIHKNIIEKIKKMGVLGHIQIVLFLLKVLLFKYGNKNNKNNKKHAKLFLKKK